MDEKTKYVTWDVHTAFSEKIASEMARRDDENKRQNTRLDKLEQNVQEIGKLTRSVDSLAQSTQTMAKQLEKQGERLDAIEQKPTKRWETVVTGILAAIAGAIGTAIAAGIIQ